MNHALVLISSAILALSVTPVLGQAPAAAPPPPGDKGKGQLLYQRFGCYQCHGTVGQGAAARFGPKIAPDPVPFSYFERQLRKPRNAVQTYTPMPVYTRKIVTDQEVADIYAYLLSIPPAKKADDIPLLNNLRD